MLGHLRLVVRIAYGYAGYGLPLADVIAEGNLGLLRAAELFDPKFNIAFATYASVWIKQRIHRAITAQAHTVRIPVWRSQRLRKLDRLHEELSAELGIDAAPDELADRLGLSAHELGTIAADRVRVESLDAPAEGRESLADQLVAPAELPAEHLSRQEIREEIIAALDGLDDMELQILSRKFGLLGDPPESFREMAPAFGRSREWIRRIGESALAKVAASFRAAGALPRALVRRRREKTRRRLEFLSRKKAPLLTRLSLLKTTLTQGYEHLFILMP